MEIKNIVVRINFIKQVYLGYNHHNADPLRASVAEGGVGDEVESFVNIIPQRPFTICVIF